MKDRLLPAIVLAVLAGGLYLALSGGRGGSEKKDEMAMGERAMGGRAGGAIVMPRLSAAASRGREYFRKKCSSCHNADGSGTRQGPPLIHPYYRPGHHSDMAFFRAAKQGVRAHHWRFGDMPPVSGVNNGQIGEIVAFIREVQRANGIF
jgi:mono/diheme cytochrome c family protein